MKHRFSNSWATRAEILAYAGRSMYESWDSIPQLVRIAILEHIQDIIEEVLNETIS